MASLNSLMSGGYDPFEIDDIAECDEYDDLDDGGEFDELIPAEEYTAVETIDPDELPF